METQRKVALLNLDGRNPLQLRKVCESLNAELVVVDSFEDFGTLIKEGGIDLAIVSIREDTRQADGKTNPNGTEDAVRASRVIKQCISPEDAGLELIFSTTGDTPEGWQRITDPVPLKFYYNSLEPRLIMRDLVWSDSDEAVKSFFSRTVEITPANRNRAVVVEFEGSDPIQDSSQIPFNTEIEFMLRAAFRGHAKIIVSQPKQGLSGASVYLVKPLDERGNLTKAMVVKIYPDVQKASDEQTKFKSYVRDRLDSRLYPEYHFDRRIVSRPFSLSVFELAICDLGSSISLRDLIISKKVDCEVVRGIVNRMLSQILKAWSPYHLSTDTDMVSKYYLDPILSKPLQYEMIESEINLNRWFNHLIPSGDLRERIISSHLADLISKTKVKICHGDLHLENILIRGEGEYLSAVLIDFSRTGLDHYLRDHATLASDLIIRGFDGVKFRSKLRSEELVSLILAGSSQADQLKALTSNGGKQQVIKVVNLMDLLMRSARDDMKASEEEMLAAILLRTLEPLSYGKLGYSQHVRAKAVVTYVLTRLGIA